MSELFQPTEVDFLLSAVGRVALGELDRADLDDSQTLPLLSALRKRYTPEQAAALLGQARLRQRAQTKFPAADQLFFTTEALEQATAYEIAAHRAAWIDRHAPAGPILELGCGIGGDTLALAQRRQIIAYETDPIRLRFAQTNVAALGFGAQVELRLADWTDDFRQGVLPDAAAAFADPARRIQGRRVFSLHQMQPPIAPLRELQRTIPALGVKVMPGVADDELPANCGVEFISHTRTCKEAVLWFGPLARHTRWASVYVGAAVGPASGWQQIVASGERPPVGPLQVGQTLHEPDPAVIRAGAFAELCRALDAQLFDPQIAYLVTARDLPHPLTQSFVVQEIHPFNVKLLNRRLQALKIGQIELKKRGMPFAPEQLRKRLKLVDNGHAGVVIFTRQGDQRLMLIGARNTQTES